MKNYIKYFVVVSAFILSTQNLFAQTSVVTYQGKLTEVGTPATGQYDFTFKLFTTPADGSPNVTVIADEVLVTAGIFTVNLNFGTLAFTAIPAIDYYIEIAVRPGTSTGAYTTLGPRQPLTSSPYSIRSLAATSADSLSSACVLCVTDGQIVAIDGSKVTGTVPVANIALTVSGVVGIENGGTGASAKSFVDLSTSQRGIRGDKEFTGAISVTDGGRFLGDGSGLTGVPAVIGDGAVTTPKLADGSVTRAKLAVDFANGFDPQNVALMRWDQIPVVPRIADVGRNPSALAFDGTFMYVANKLDNNVMRIRISTGLIEGSPIPVGNAPAALVYDGFRSIWVANSGAGTVSRISILNAAVDMTINVGSQPCALAFDGNLINVADCNSNEVTRVTKAGAVVDSIIVGHRSISLAFDGAHMYVMEPFNHTTGVGGLLRRIHVGTGAVEIIVSGLNAGSLAFDGTFIYAASGSSVLRIRSSTGVLETRHIALTNSLALNNAALVFDGRFLYGSGIDNGVVGASGDAVVKLNTTGLTSETNPIPAQGFVTALAFDGTYIYAASNRIDNSTGTEVVLNGVVTRF